MKKLKGEDIFHACIRLLKKSSSQVRLVCDYCTLIKFTCLVLVVYVIISW